MRGYFLRHGRHRACWRRQQASSSPGRSNLFKTSPVQLSLRKGAPRTEAATIKRPCAMAATGRRRRCHGAAAALAAGNTDGIRQRQSPTDLKRDARAAWKRFVGCLRLLPAHKVAPLWQAALSEVAAICRHFIEPRSGLATDLGECERSPRRDKPGILVSALGSDKELVFCFYLFCHFFPHPRESCWVLLCGM